MYAKIIELYFLRALSSQIACIYGFFVPHPDSSLVVGVCAALYFLFVGAATVYIMYFDPGFLLDALRKREKVFSCVCLCMCVCLYVSYYLSIYLSLSISLSLYIYVFIYVAFITWIQSLPPHPLSLVLNSLIYGFFF